MEGLLKNPIPTKCGSITTFDIRKAGVYSVYGLVGTETSPLGIDSHFGMLLVLPGGPYNKQLYIDDYRGFYVRNFSDQSFEEKWKVISYKR